MGRSRSSEESMRRAILFCRSHGANAIPLCPSGRGHERLWSSHLSSCRSPGKVPLASWKGLHEAMASSEYVDRWIEECLRRGSVPNVGCVMGKSSRLVSIDADGSEAVQAVESSLPRTLLGTARFETGRGVRWVFSVPEGMPYPRSEVVRKGIEVLSQGRQSVFPPSIHANGKTYRWAGGSRCDTWMRRVLPWEEDAMARFSASRPLPTPSMRTVPRGGRRMLREGERNDALFRMACSLRRHGAGMEDILGCLHVLRPMCEGRIADEELESIAASASRYEPKEG